MRPRFLATFGACRRRTPRARSSRRVASERALQNRVQETDDTNLQASPRTDKKNPSEQETHTIRRPVDSPYKSFFSGRLCRTIPLCRKRKNTTQRQPEHNSSKNKKTKPPLLNWGPDWEIGLDELQPRDPLSDRHDTPSESVVSIRFETSIAWLLVLCHVLLRYRIRLCISYSGRHTIDRAVGKRACV